jgi:hypothetical protein
MHATVATVIVINAAPSKVLKYLAKLKHHYLWNPQIRKMSSTRRFSDCGP